MRVHLDMSRCQGHARCSALAPDLFDLDVEGFATPRVEAPFSDEQLIAQARRAVTGCPEQAIQFLDT